MWPGMVCIPSEIIIKYNTSQRPQSFYYHIVSLFIFHLIASAANTNLLPKSSSPLLARMSIVGIHLVLLAGLFVIVLTLQNIYLFFGNCQWRVVVGVGFAVGPYGADEEGIKRKFGKLIRGGK